MKAALFPDSKKCLLWVKLKFTVFSLPQKKISFILENNSALNFVEGNPFEFYKRNAVYFLKIIYKRCLKKSLREREAIRKTYSVAREIFPKRILYQKILRPPFLFFHFLTHDILKHSISGRVTIRKIYRVVFDKCANMRWTIRENTEPVCEKFFDKNEILKNFFIFLQIVS